MNKRKVKSVKNKQPERIVRDYTAKHMGAHRCAEHRDKKNDYRRSAKHKGSYEW